MLLCVILIYPIHSLSVCSHIQSSIYILFLLSHSHSVSLAHSHFFTFTFVLYWLYTLSTLTYIFFFVYFQLLAIPYMECIWRVSIGIVIWNRCYSRQIVRFFSLSMQSVQIKEKKTKHLMYSLVKNHRNLMNM